ncbi:MAG: glycosyltransferase family 4 protein [Pyrinomonadaceae bacterium]
MAYCIRRMRVIYDISKLGEDHRSQLGRTGLSRVVEKIAQGLAVSPECEVMFSATESFEALSGCLDYLELQPEFKDIPLISPRSTRFRKALEARALRMNAEINGPPFSDLLKAPESSWAFVQSLKIHKRAERKLLTYTHQAFGGGGQQFDPRWFERVDLFHSPLYPLPSWVANVDRFLTLYDLIPVLLPQFCVPGQTQFTNEVLESIKPGDWVISISESTRNDLCNHIRIDPERVFVTHLAAEPELFYRCLDPEKIAAARTRYGIPEGPYILSLNTLEPRKNVSHVVASFAKLVQEQNIKDLNLVLVGARGWLYGNILETVAAYGSLKERIIVTGYVADEHLAALYSDALAFVFPSFYEGFGLPPLEAMQCGVPVITSNTSSLPEVVGNAGVMFEPTDADGLCHAILRLYHSPSLREKMSTDSLARAQQFSWEKSVQQTITAYKIALSR